MKLFSEIMSKIYAKHINKPMRTIVIRPEIFMDQMTNSHGKNQK